MNDTGTFLLGVVAAAVLFLLWKKERQPGGVFAPQPGSSNGTGTGSCAGCACGIGGGCGTAPQAPASAAAPSFQNDMQSLGLAGQITPGTPPLGGQDLSFYGPSGPTPDNTFSFIKPATPANVPGSASTPAYQTPVRATAPVPGYPNQVFVQHYNIVGVPLSTARRVYLQ